MTDKFLDVINGQLTRLQVMIDMIKSRSKPSDKIALLAYELEGIILTTEDTLRGIYGSGTMFPLYDVLLAYRHVLGKIYSIKYENDEEWFLTIKKMLIDGYQGCKRLKEEGGSSEEYGDNAGVFFKVFRRGMTGYQNNLFDIIAYLKANVQVRDGENLLEATRRECDKAQRERERLQRKSEWVIDYD